MSVANSVFRWYIKWHYRDIISYSEYPIDTQKNVFKALIDAAKYTEWGKKYDYSSILRIDTFKERVPVTEYDDFAPYIRRMMKGESDILWRGTVRWFSKSSGTTNDKSKFLPVSEESLEECHLKGGHDVMAAWYHHNPNTELFSGKLMAMGGTTKAFEDYPDHTVGDVSAIMMKTMPFYARFFMAPDIDIAILDNWEQKIEAMAQELIHENLTNLNGVPTWTIVLFRRILELTGKKNMLEVWPNFELYIHGGVSFEPYREQFRTFFPSDSVKYWGVYNASEGFFAAQLSPDSDMSLLLKNGVFYEFMPLEELGKPFPKTYQLDEVELDKTYALIISTNAGLWRYNIGDTIRFTSLNPFRIKIVGRTKHFINVFGEELMVENADKAIALACAETGAVVSEYSVAPIYFEGTDGKGGHEWLVEFDVPPIDTEVFAEKLDYYLRQANSDYEAKRFKGMAMERLVLRVIPKGLFHQWLKSKGKYGGQHKIPRLSNQRDYIEDILRFWQANMGTE